MWTHRYTTWGLIGLLLVVLALWMRSEYDGARELSEIVRRAKQVRIDRGGGSGDPPGAYQSQHVTRNPSSQKWFSLEQQRKMGRFAPDGAPNFSLVGKDGIVSRQALEWAGVDLGRTRAIQKVISGLWAKETARMQSQMIRDPDKSGNFYLIESVPGHADVVLGGLEQDLADIVGKPAAGKLMLCLQPTNLFGWFGKYDVELELMDGPGGTKVRYQSRWPETGDPCGGGSGPPNADGVRLMFGPNFKFETKK